MQIKTEKNSLSFVFSEKDTPFELGYLSLDQLDLPWILLGNRSFQRGKEKYQVSIKGCKPLLEILGFLEEKEQLSCFFQLFYGIYRVEELGIMPKQSIWCKYEHIFWNEKEKRLGYVVLPVEKEPSYEDGLFWEERLRECMHFLSKNLSFEHQKRVLELSDAYLQQEISALSCMEQILSWSEADLCKGKALPPRQTQRALSLAFLGEDASYEYQLQQDEILLGKSQENCDVAFPFSRAMSRMHCRILRQNQNFFVQDLDSVNHTRVNGVFVPPFELMELANHDLITMGDIEIRINIQDL